MVTKEGGTGRLCPRVTIDVLPDTVLLEGFEFYLGKDGANEIDKDYNYDGWQTLVHVCRKWRCIVFASPRRLDLKLYLTQERLVKSKTLEIWPTFPIVISAQYLQSKEDATNVIIAALRHRNRVCKIRYYNWGFPDSFLNKFAAIDQPFPALTSLGLLSNRNPPVFPDSFLGGSAPRLRSLYLTGIPYLSIGKLLSSTTNLVRLSLHRIPQSGYIAPETIVPCLSTLARLESLSLGLQDPRSRAHRASRHPPPLTRVLFPNLTSLGLSGDIEYSEDILSQIETPILSDCRFDFFNPLVFDTPLLWHFIRRTETFMTIRTAHVQFFTWAAGITFLGRKKMANNKWEALLRLEITCDPFDWQLSALAQVLNSLSFSLPTLESLDIAVYHEDWQDEIQVEVTQWREFLHPFTSVKEIILETEDSVRLIAPALQELAGERETEVLPAL